MLILPHQRDSNARGVTRASALLFREKMGWGAQGQGPLSDHNAFCAESVTSKYLMNLRIIIRSTCLK